MTYDLYRAAQQVRDALGPDVTGECYVASEALYHLAGGRGAGLTPYVMPAPPNAAGRGTHWFLVAADGDVLDLTADQFDVVPDYTRGRGCGFLTTAPSRRARVLIGEVLGSALLGRAFGREDVVS